MSPKLNAPYSLFLKFHKSQDLCFYRQVHFGEVRISNKEGDGILGTIFGSVLSRESL